MESFHLAFQLHVKVCPGAISVHLNLVGPALVLWGRVSGIHTHGMSRIADIATGYNRMRCTMVTAGWLTFYNKIFSRKILIKYFHYLFDNSHTNHQESDTGSLSNHPIAGPYRQRQQGASQACVELFASTAFCDQSPSSHVGHMTDSPHHHHHHHHHHHLLPAH